MKPASIEEKVAVNKYDIDREVHIQVKEETCRGCEERYCLYVCPANCYTLTEQNEVVFSYEPCLECGSCRIVCKRGAIDWILPRPGLGICYEYG